MTQELLTETWGNTVSVEVENINESKNGSGGKLYIKGIFMQAEIKNANGRIYPKKVLEKAVNAYKNKYILTHQAIGETNHPDRAMPDPNHATILVEDLWWDGNNVLGKAVVITGDYGSGDKLAALLNAGWKPGLSSRGLGRCIDGIVQDGYVITAAADVVWGPSAPDAYAESVTESAIINTNKISNLASIAENMIKSVNGNKLR